MPVSMNMLFSKIKVVCCLFMAVVGVVCSGRPDSESGYASPIGLEISQVRSELYVANQTISSVSVVDLNEGEMLWSVEVGQFPTDLQLSADESLLYVSCLYDYSVQVIDLSRREVVEVVKVGYEPYGLALSSDGAKLWVANSMSETLLAISTETYEPLFESPVGRNPRYVAEIPSVNTLAVTNGLSRNVTYLDSRDGSVLETRDLDRASLLRDVKVTADGKYVIAAGLIAHDEMITMQIERGWINSNGLFVMEVGKRGHFVTVPLDSLLDGAANPWGLVLSADGSRLYASLAGVHEVAYVDLERLLKLVADTRSIEVTRLSQDVEIFDKAKLGKRFKTGGVGPRGMVLDEKRSRLYVANYFTNDVSVMDAVTGVVEKLIPMEGASEEISIWRKGEMLFNDARICQQNYYSCASCHQEDGTMDGLNWDLINDGKGNPKNAKSLHDAMDTPPVMWSGVRANMFAGVAAGQRFLGFIPNEENHEALTAYLGDPPRAPNPFREEDAAAIERGEILFNRSRCQMCHVAPTYEDGRRHDLGLKADFEVRSRFYTPSLREVYRTGPYLHNGFAESLEEIFTKYNPENKHGLTKGLTESDIADLVAYLKTL